MTNKIMCHTCRGLKKANGLGGISRDCWTCNATGKIDALMSVDAPKNGDTGTCTLADIFPGTKEGLALQSEADKAEIAAALPAIEAKADVVRVDTPIEPAFEGYSKELIAALLDEPKMPLVEWKKKHMHNKELFIVAKDARGNDQVVSEILDLHMRNAVRVMYAQSKPIAPRKVDAMAAQDMVAKKDSTYIKYEREQKAKAELEAKRANEQN